MENTDPLLSIRDSIPDVLVDYLKTNEDNLVREMVEHPTRYLEVSRYAARRLAEQTLAELECKRVEGNLYLQFKSGEAPIPGIPKPTEDTIKAAVRTHPEWIAAQERYAKAEELCSMYFGFLESLRMKERTIRALAWKQGLGVATDDVKDVGAGPRQSFEQRWGGSR